MIPNIIHDEPSIKRGATGVTASVQSHLISIITPTFNHAKYIGQCIESVLSQSWTSLEQIIVDDGSTDDTVAIARRYAARDDRIKVIAHEHRGPKHLGDLYNEALNEATGPWIAVLEGDDYWPKEKLEIQIPSLGDDTIFSYGVFINDTDGSLSEGPRPSFEGVVKTSEFQRIALLHRSFVLAVTQVIRRDALIQIGGFQQNGSPAAVDFETMLSLTTLPGNIYFLPEVLGYWRHHSAQSTNTLAIQIAEHNAKRALAFFDSLSPLERQMLKIQRREIERARRRQVADVYFGTLRHRVGRTDRDVVLPLLRGTWSYGGPKRKLQSAYAALAMVIGTDIELPLRYYEKCLKAIHAVK